MSNKDVTSTDGTGQDSLYSNLCEKVADLRDAGFEPDRVVVPGDEWRSIKDQAEVLEGEGVADSDKTLVNGVLTVYDEPLSKARVIHKVGGGSDE